MSLIYSLVESRWNTVLLSEFETNALVDCK